MNNTEINRQIVQEGLDRRASKRNEALEDARHDAAERDLRQKINAHNAACIAEEKAARTNQKRTAEQIARDKYAAESRLRKRAENHEAALCCEFYRFLIKSFSPMIISVLLIYASNVSDSIPLNITLPFSIVGCMISVELIAARLLHNGKS